MRSGAFRTGAFAVFLLLGAPMGRATILTFDQARTSAGVIPAFSGATLPGDYGDRASGPVVPVPGGAFTYAQAGEGFTPNVGVDFFAGTGLPLSIWQNEYGDLTNVVFGLQSSQSLNVRLTADPGFETQLYGFDLAGWPNTDWSISSIEVLAGSSSLFLETAVLVQGDFSGPRHTSFSFPTPLTAQELLIRVDLSNLPAGLQDNIGLDNLRFGQDPRAEVPEPATVFLLLLAGAALGAGITRTRPAVERARERRSPFASVRG